MLRLPALRRWQKEALVRFESHTASSFLAVATPGAGKTTFALMAARRALIARRGSRVIVVVPTAHLKTQWADAAEGCGLLLEPEWRTGAALPGDVHGIVLTYQQAAMAPAAIARIARDAFAILDEVHHAGETRSWGDAIREGLSPAAQRLCISGTPFRSDDAAIPFVRYDGDEADAWDSDDDIAAEEEWMAEEESAVEIAAAVPLPAQQATPGHNALAVTAPAPVPAPPAREPTTRKRRRQLRELNQLKVESLVGVTQLSHAQVNARLNKQVGLRRISEASEQQLEVRLRNADQWFRSVGGARAS